VAGESSAPIRVLIADDEDDVRDLLAEMIRREPDLELAAVAADAAEAVAAAERERPDVAIIDAHMPEGGGVRALREIAQRVPSTATVVLSAFDSQAKVVEHLDAGAIAYLVKPVARKDLVATLEQAVAAHRS
jgi:DNA-binding NarL/FixJ family response regulator